VHGVLGDHRVTEKWLADVVQEVPDPDRAVQS